MCCAAHWKYLGMLPKPLCSLGIAFTGLEMAAECPARVAYFLLLKQVTAFGRILKSQVALPSVNIKDFSSVLVFCLSQEGSDAFFVPEGLQESPQPNLFLQNPVLPLTREVPGRPMFGHFFSFLDTKIDTKSGAELWRVVVLCKLHCTPS